MKMELFVANSDGSNAKQITNFGCASFAPTFTPDGKKILFASNKHHCDSSDFELYLINTDGTGLEQVTQLRRVHVVSRSFRRTEEAGVRFQLSGQGQLRVQHFHRGLEIGSF